MFPWGSRPTLCSCSIGSRASRRNGESCIMLSCLSPASSPACGKDSSSCPSACICSKVLPLRGLTLSHSSSASTCGTFSDTLILESSTSCTTSSSSRSSEDLSSEPFSDMYMISGVPSGATTTCDCLREGLDKGENVRTYCNLGSMSRPLVLAAESHTPSSCTFIRDLDPWYQTPAPTSTAPRSRAPPAKAPTNAASPPRWPAPSGPGEAPGSALEANAVV
mmetsp:Transcript_4070/g.12213  ORF Transcript_4070/g.12213 Transcript_4070/m.12213 type:complete len:221 (+) Transcript_4070:299-961(+)